MEKSHKIIATQNEISFCDGDEEFTIQLPYNPYGEEKPPSETPRLCAGFIGYIDGIDDLIYALAMEYASKQDLEYEHFKISSDNNCVEFFDENRNFVERVDIDKLDLPSKYFEIESNFYLDKMVEEINSHQFDGIKAVVSFERNAYNGEQYPTSVRISCPDKYKIVIDV